MIERDGPLQKIVEIGFHDGRVDVDVRDKSVRAQQLFHGNLIDMFEEKPVIVI